MGSGYKNFTAASVLTAADLNNYCQSQSVMYFASTTARDSAIASPVAGMVAYIDSGDANEGLYVYAGATGGWKKGPGWNAPWGIIDYKSDTSARTSPSTGTAAEMQSVLRTTGTYIANRYLRITLEVTIAASTSGGFIFEVWRNPTGTPALEQRIAQYGASIASYGVNNSIIIPSTSGAVYSPYWNVVTAGQTITTYGNLSGLTTRFIVEDIGPSGAPV